MELNLAKPGKLAATAEYAKDFTFYLSRSEYQTGGFEEGDQQILADDLIFSKAKVAAQKTGQRTRRGVVDLGPEAKKLTDRIEEIEAKTGEPIQTVYAYCVATSEEGAKKEAKACEMQVVRPPVVLKITKRPEKGNYDFKSADKNVLEVGYEATSSPKAVEVELPPDSPFKLAKKNETTKSKEKIAGTFTFSAEVPAQGEVTLRATSARLGGAPVEETVHLEIAAGEPKITLKANKESIRQGEVLELKVDIQNVSKVEITFDPPGIFQADKTTVFESGTVKITAVQAGTARLKAQGFVGKADSAVETLPLEAKPFKLKIAKHEKEVKWESTLRIMVDFENLDSVTLKVEPDGRLNLPSTGLKQPDTVEVSGKRDGKVTLTASGLIGGASKIQDTLQLDVHGPLVAIEECGLRKK